MPKIGFKTFWCHNTFLGFSYTGRKSICLSLHLSAHSTQTHTPLTAIPTNVLTTYVHSACKQVIHRKLSIFPPEYSRQPLLSFSLWLHLYTHIAGAEVPSLILFSNGEILHTYSIYLSISTTHPGLRSQDSSKCIRLAHQFLLYIR